MDHALADEFSQFEPTTLNEEAQISSRSNEEVTIIYETSLECEEEIIIEDASNSSPPVTSHGAIQRQEPTWKTDCTASIINSPAANQKSNEEPENFEKQPLQHRNFENDAPVHQTYEKLGNVLKGPESHHQKQKSGNGYRCLSCNKLFLSQLSFELHAAIHNRSGIKTITHGFVALKASQKARKFSSQKKNHDAQKKTENSCKFCNCKCQPAVKPKKKGFWCNTCKKFFATFSYFQNHRQQHFQPQPNKCQYCEKTFTRPYQLKRHVMIHTAEKPYVCVTCQKPYRRLDSLQRHARKCSAPK